MGGGKKQYDLMPGARLIEAIEDNGGISDIEPFLPGRIKAKKKKRAPSDDGLRPIFFDKLKRDCQWTPIETAMVAEGVPDSEYCFAAVQEGGYRGTGGQGWLEFKRSDAWAVTVRPLQAGWITKRVRMGGRVTIAIRRVKDELWLVDGVDVVLLQAKGLKPFMGRVPVWKGGPNKWNWNQIRRYLRDGAGWMLPE